MSIREQIAGWLEDENPRRALAHALAKGDASDIRWALEHGANLDDHRQPLVAAVSRGNDPIQRAAVVLEKGAEVDIDALNSAARRAGEERALKLVQFLIESSDVDINYPDRFGWTPLTHAVARENMLLTRYLLGLGATDAIVLGDHENTGGYPPGWSIRDIARKVDDFQIEQGFHGPGQDGPGGFLEALETAWGRPPAPSLAGRWRCIGQQINDQQMPWLDEELGEAFVNFDRDGTFVFDAMFRIEGEWHDLSARVDDLELGLEFFAGGESLAVTLPEFAGTVSYAELTELSGATFYFRSE